MKRVIILLLFALGLATTALAEGYSPVQIANVQTHDYRHYTANPDGILSAEAVATIDSICLSLKERGLAEVAVVAVRKIDSDDIFEWGVELFEQWGVGDDKLDNGLGVLLVEDMHEIRFFTGYGLEGVLPDALCVRLQQHYMLPWFREGDYSQGMVEGLRAVDELLTNGELPIAQQDESEEMLLALIIVAIMVLLPIAIILIADRSQRRCPSCGKVALRVVDSTIISRTAFKTVTRQRLVCSNCGAEHTRTTKRDNGLRGGGGGPIIFGGGGGFGGGFGGGGFGGGFGGGSFGGGGGGSRW